MRPSTLVALLTFALPALAQEAREAPGYLGVQVTALDGEARRVFGIDPGCESGVVLSLVSEDSPAARAGLRPGDVVTSFDRKPLRAPEDLVRAVQARRPGDRVEYVVRRGPGTIAGILTLGRRQEGPPRAPGGAGGDGEAEPMQGVEELQARVRELRERFLEAREQIERLRRPRTLEGWIRREQEMLREAEARGDQEALRHHASRLEVLRELRDAGMELAERRLAAIESKLDEILALLRR